MTSKPQFPKEILSLFPVATRKSYDITLSEGGAHMPQSKLSLFKARELLLESSIEWTEAMVSDLIGGTDHVWRATGKRDGSLLILMMCSELNLEQARKAAQSGSPDPWAGLSQGSEGPWTIKGDTIPSESEIDQAIRSFPEATHINSSGFVDTGGFRSAEYSVYTRKGIPWAKLHVNRMTGFVSIQAKNALNNPISAIIADHVMAQLATTGNS